MRELTRKRADKPLPRLQRAMDRRNAQWLESNYMDVADALRQEIEEGATADEIGKLARQVSGDQDWFAKKVFSAARHVESVIAARK